MTDLGGAERFVEPSERAPESRRALSSGELVNAWELDEFFEALGPMFRLPPKEAAGGSARAGPTASALPGDTAVRRARWLVRMALALLSATALGFALQTFLQRSRPLPPELVGAWRTTEASHADRVFELSPDTLRLGLGEGGTVSYPIVRVRANKSEGVTLYTVQYRDGSSTLDFPLTAGPDSSVRIAHLPEVAWRKTPR